MSAAGADGLDAVRRYQKRVRRDVCVPFILSTERELFDHVKAQPNASGYIKRLIREDMAKQK